MEEIVEMAQGMIKPSKSQLAPIAAIWPRSTLACCISAATVPVKVIAGVSAVGAVAGALALAVPPTWHNIQSYSVRNTRASLKSLRCAFEQNNVGERHRDALEPSKFKYLKWILVDF
ncbi:hypothetical protein E5D57_011970 [Metarhizium anisopliae]|nr:hypothetical protein E5D57_011970 [Metarhizium anisopliae]